MYVCRYSHAFLMYFSVRFLTEFCRTNSFCVFSTLLLSSLLVRSWLSSDLFSLSMILCELSRSFLGDFTFFLSSVVVLECSMFLCELVFSSALLEMSSMTACVFVVLYFLFVCVNWSTAALSSF